MKTPKIICICGSTKFLEEEREIYFRLTMQGKIVLSHSGRRVRDKVVGGFFDKLHFDKIDLADEIYVINLNGYIGKSTKNEIEYAERLGKPIIYMEMIKAKLRNI